MIGVLWRHGHGYGADGVSTNQDLTGPPTCACVMSFLLIPTYQVYEQQNRKLLTKLTKQRATTFLTHLIACVEILFLIHPYQLISSCQALDQASLMMLMASAVWSAAFKKNSEFVKPPLPLLESVEHFEAKDSLRRMEHFEAKDSLRRIEPL
jgi:hypothetical protein